MPPSQLPRPQEKYSKTTGFLIRSKVVLDLIVGDLLRLILTIVLLALLIGVGFIGFTYRGWLPKAESYLAAYGINFSDATTTESVGATR